LWSYLPTFILNPKSLKILSLILVWEMEGGVFAFLLWIKANVGVWSVLLPLRYLD
jgi:hypothetical protein